MTIAQVTATVDLHLLVDTGADVTLLAPRDTAALGLNLRSFPHSRSTGIGGTTETAIVPADITLDTHTLSIDLRMLMPQRSAQSRARPTVPSLLGRDVLGQFGLYVDERRNLVLLLEPGEADALNLA
ncbi:MAG: aspartyl protease family protein [Dehalococcoidia bacterium]